MKEPTPIQLLAEGCAEKWPAINAARERTTKLVDDATRALAKIDDPQASVVVTGSVARGEATLGSDFDWMLLIDGTSEPQHLLLARKVSDTLENLGKKPGQTETFGKLVSSHDLIHYIAGTKDTNENLTRRILLLLESTALTNAPLRESHSEFTRTLRHLRSFDSGKIWRVQPNSSFSVERRSSLLADDGR